MYEDWEAYARGWTTGEGRGADEEDTKVKKGGRRKVRKRGGVSQPRRGNIMVHLPPHVFILPSNNFR